MLVVDAELSPSQARNLEDATGIAICDRELVILNVFLRNARTRRARIQVEIAHLEYLRPRIRGLGLDMDQQAGGMVKARGPGETASELLARQLDGRLVELRKQLARLARSGDTQRKGREACSRIVLVGYTNAGKTSLMNALASAELSARDVPFETLDTTSRCLTRHGGDVILSDTVGFIRRLPPRLLESFESTLAEIVEASLVVVVVDASDPEWEMHLELTEAQITRLGAGQVPRFYVLNKLDRVATAPSPELLAGVGRGHGAMAVCSHDPAAMERLRAALIGLARKEHRQGAGHGALRGHPGDDARVRRVPRARGRGGGARLGADDRGGAARGGTAAARGPGGTVMTASASLVEIRGLLCRHPGGAPAVSRAEPRPRARARGARGAQRGGQVHAAAASSRARRRSSGARSCVGSSRGSSAKTVDPGEVERAVEWLQARARGDRASARAITQEAAELGLAPLAELVGGRQSRGEARKLLLLAARLSAPALLLLDEPTEDLDEVGVAWLCRWLHRWEHGAVVVSHHRGLLQCFEHFFLVAESGCRHVPGSFAALERLLEQESAAREQQYVKNLEVLDQQERRNEQILRRRQRKKNVGRLHELDRCTSKMRSTPSAATHRRARRGWPRSARSESRRCAAGPRPRAAR
jgi:GTP-binding protein HflX